MTTRRLIGLLFVLAVACTTGRSTMRGGLPEARLATYPEEVQASYRLFAARCSRCHTLSRPLGAAITDHGHWEAYVKRMRHHAGSGISRADGEKILVFLRYYADEQVSGDAPPPEEAPPPATAPPPAPPPQGAAAQ